MRYMFVTCSLIGVVLSTGACVTTQVFRVEDHCRPAELPLGRPVTVVLEGERHARMHGFLESADADSLRLMTSVDGQAVRFPLACRDVLSVTYEFKDREKTRRLAKSAGIGISVALLVVALAVCVDSEDRCRFPDSYDGR